MALGGIKIGDSVNSVYAIYSEDKVRLENLRGYAEGQFCPGLEILNDKNESSNNW